MKASWHGILILLSLIPILAHADLYDDRQKQKQEQADIAKVQEMKAAHDAEIREYLVNLAAFAKAHGGLASAPQCFDFSYDIDSHSMWMRDRRECNGSYCVSVRGEGTGLSSPRPDDTMYWGIILRDSLISYCRVTLNNGLACSVSNDYEKMTFGGNCIDAHGNERDVISPLIHK